MPNSPETPDKLRDEFFAAGKTFFGWNSGKNTPNILLMLSERIGALENSITITSTELTHQINALQKTIQESSTTSTRLSRSLNLITLLYVLLTGIIALATGAQVWLALRAPHHYQSGAYQTSEQITK